MKNLIEVANDNLRLYLIIYNWLLKQTVGMSTLNDPLGDTYQEVLKHNGIEYDHKFDMFRVPETLLSIIILESDFDVR